jgi:hypothetical protein
MKIKFPDIFDKLPEPTIKPVDPEFVPTARQLAYSIFDQSAPEQVEAELWLRTQADIGE